MEISAALFARITAVIINMDDAFDEYLTTKYREADIPEAKLRCNVSKLRRILEAHK